MAWESFTNIGQRKKNDYAKCPCYTYTYRMAEEKRVNGSCIKSREACGYRSRREWVRDDKSGA